MGPLSREILASIELQEVPRYCSMIPSNSDSICPHLDIIGRVI